MRTFSSYGQIHTDLNYYAPRTALLDRAYTQLLGEYPEEGGHYITVWAPRQTGKSTVMLEAVKRLRQLEQFDTVILTLESAKGYTDEKTVLEIFLHELSLFLRRELPAIETWKELPKLFERGTLDKPLILILDEFDALAEPAINKFAGEFRKIYTARFSESDKSTEEKSYLLHGLALIGVRSVLGIENVSGSPFNVQRSVHIPNLTFQEVEGLFKWYERESGQTVEQDVIERIYTETNGQPGLTCWLGEILTEGHDYYRPNRERPLTMEVFEKVYKAAIYTLPNNNILNIISKANQDPYQAMVLDLFQTEDKIEFRYDDKSINYLYQNGAIDHESGDASAPYIKFASPFVQKRLFNYFAYELFSYTGKLHEPFEDLSDVYTPAGLNFRGLAVRFQAYLRKNRHWLLEDAPRRKDLRIFEAVFHFSFYRFLYDFLGTRDAVVYPEFPTGNGQIDLLVIYRGARYGVELKSFTSESEYYHALEQAARYGKQLQLPEISLISFVEYVSEETRRKYEVDTVDKASGVTVIPIFVETGN